MYLEKLIEEPRHIENPSNWRFYGKHVIFRKRLFCPDRHQKIRTEENSMKRNARKNATKHLIDNFLCHGI
jgi:hypothetical protein